MKYRVELDDFLKATEAVTWATNPRRAAKQGWRGKTLTYGVLILVLLVWNIAVHLHRGELDALNLPFLGLLLLIVFSTFYSPIRYRKQLKAQYRLLELHNETFDLAWSSSDLSISCENSSTVFKWKGLKAVLDLEEAFILLLNDVQYFALPKRYFTTAEHEAFRQALIQHSLAKAT